MLQQQLTLPIQNRILLNHGLYIQKWTVPMVELLAGFATLTVLEIVLGIDNIVFLAIISERLPENERERARKLGLMIALIMRVALLFGIGYLVKLTAPWFTLLDHPFSGRDLILLGGGLFLLIKGTLEIHATVEANHPDQSANNDRKLSFVGAIIQIGILDMVFSLDSVITAVGMVDEIGVMIAAVVVAIGVMIVFAGRISSFISANPTLKVLALSFLILIGFVLVADGLGRHIEKGYVYFAVAFSLGVEVLNSRMRERKRKKLAPQTNLEA